MMCSRCKETVPIHEWSYRPTAFQGNGGWRHCGPGDAIDPDTGRYPICGWVAKVPQKIRY